MGESFGSSERVRGKPSSGWAPDLFPPYPVLKFTSGGVGPFPRNIQGTAIRSLGGRFILSHLGSYKVYRPPI